MLIGFAIRLIIAHCCCLPGVTTHIAARYACTVIYSFSPNLLSLIRQPRCGSIVRCSLGGDVGGWCCDVTERSGARSNLI